MLKKIFVLVLSFSLSGLIFAQDKETKPAEKEKKENYGQERSAEVNKGKQGAKMRAKNKAKKEAKKKAKEGQKKAQKKADKQSGKK